MSMDPVLQKRARRFVLLTVFIYSAGFGIIMPALPDLIRELEHVSLSDATRIGAWIGATYAIFQFALGPLAGNLGDRFGRRPVFLISLFSFGLDFLLMGLANSIIWLFIGRAIAGGLGAIFGPANAAMADLSAEKDRAASFGKVGAAFGIGFIIGPAIGGFMADGPLLVTAFSSLGLHSLGTFLADHSTRLPFFMAAGLALGNFIYGWFVFPETMAKERRRSFDWKRANPLGALQNLAKVGSILPIALIYFLWSFAGQIYPACWAFFAQAQYGWSTGMVGLSLASVGVSMALCQMFIIGRAVERFGERRTTQIGMAMGLACFLLYAFNTSGALALAICFFNGLQGIAQPALNSMMSRRMPADRQGELQGFNGSMAALAFLLAQLVFNFTLAYFTSDAAPVRFAGAPFVISAVFAIVGLLLVTRLPKAPVAEARA